MNTELLQLAAGLLAGAIGLCGYIPYIRGIVKGVVKPSPVSWLIWALLGIVSLSGQVEGGAGFGLVVTAGTTAGCALIVLLAVRRTRIRAAVAASSWLDGACLAGAILALALLMGQADRNAAVILSNTVGAIGFIPTVASALRAPSREGISVYAFAAVKFALSLAALPNWNILTVLYPALCLAEEIAMVGLLLFVRASSRAARISAK
ncbi:hypothetical protein [Arthrobacter bambusae]|uniref:Uncharacterized protein n=1 Tax=Arthrobacter bambusae TaxID=1338426 RepID=A0AAW8D2U8_9MICC|nr:hypothetical protein [Arthrobacter bambusae]MDP9903221.1 hypothetical protein [Arthrobacter bambusae]MDQ0128785.1 hypothetical protein [Arthrobacter bambusae]MDQ0180126.1 hypothetical protein [Arthrobacter bambusae]